MIRTDAPGFIVDFMLGRLARWLRVLGYDAVYVRPEPKDGCCKDSFSRNCMLLRSLKDNRIVLSRDSSLSGKKALRLVHIRSDKWEEQLAQVIAELRLRPSAERLYTRCPVCNGALRPAERRTAEGKVHSYVLEHAKEFFVCPDCGKIYWKGSHYELLVKDLKKAGITLCS